MLQYIPSFAHLLLPYQPCTLVHALTNLLFFIFLFLFVVAESFSFQSLAADSKAQKESKSAIPAKIPKGKASPLGFNLVAAVKSEPDRNGPAARPAAESV